MYMASHHRQKSLLRYKYSIMLFRFADVSRFESNHDGASRELAYDQADLKLCGHGHVDPLYFGEYDRICF